MQDKVSRAQSFPAYHSSARASVHLDCTESSVLLPALSADSLLAFSRSHMHKLQKYGFQPQSSVLPITLLIWLFSTCAVPHVSFFSFVCSLESCCLLCNHVCSLENLVQIDESQIAFEMWQDSSFFSALRLLCSQGHWTYEMSSVLWPYLASSTSLSLEELQKGQEVAFTTGSSCSFESFPAVLKQSWLEWRAVFAVPTTAEMEDCILEQLKHLCVQTQDLWTTEDGLAFQQAICVLHPSS